MLTRRVERHDEQIVERPTRDGSAAEVDGRGHFAGHEHPVVGVDRHGIGFVVSDAAEPLAENVLSVCVQLDDERVVVEADEWASASVDRAAERANHDHRTLRVHGRTERDAALRGTELLGPQWLSARREFDHERIGVAGAR